jgi:hypothetical protein
VNNQPIRSTTQHLWSWVLCALVLVILLNLIWSLLQGVMWLAVAIVVAGVTFTVWQRRRWR